MKIIIKVALIAIIFGCLFKMPYGYYQFVRWSCFLLFCAHTYISASEETYWAAVLSGIGAILFNPIAKFYFKRDVWQQIDKATIAVLVVWMLVEVFIWLYNSRKKRVLPF